MKKLFKRVGRVFLAASLLATGLVATAPPAAKADFDVYTTPGTHNINGRQWRTTCGKYSSTVERCTTNIWATTVSYTGGRFVQSNGWVFNNLTYKPSPRATWKGNPLATPGYHTIDGRRWYTECDTDWTGGNACRSLLEANIISRSGSSFRWEKKFIFNNIVRFTTAPTTPAPPATPKLKWYDLTKQKVVARDQFEAIHLKEGAISIGTQYFPEAYYVRPASNYERTASASFALGGHCTSFEVTIGARADSTYTSEPLLYRFYVDGQQVGETHEVAPFKSKKVSVDVTKGVQLKLWWHHKAGGGQAAWGAPQIKCSSDPNPRG